MKRTAYLYIRVSTDEQAEKGFSQRDQAERLTRYCEINNIEIAKVIFEDHSAKNFKRPEWAKMLLELKKRNSKTNLILFTKWDRFSRNIAYAYQMISLLHRSGVEPQAIEQPLDMEIPESKLMLAVYLAGPEVENDRRALNVFYGQRRARKEGRYVSTAPIGYINRHSDDGKTKYIAIREGEGDILRWAFTEIASGRTNTEQIWRAARSKGLTRGSKNNFWVAIRNPLYCGKIFVPKFKNEEAHLVLGQHEPLISESLFNEVQMVLDGRKKVMRPKQVSDENLPLRGYLICPKCGRMLTGSASKGRNQYYHYYHCSSECGVRHKAEIANNEIEKEIQKYVIKFPALSLYKEAISITYKNQTSHERQMIKTLKFQLEETNNKLTKARDLLLSDAIGADDFRAIKAGCESKIEELENKLFSTTNDQPDLSPLWDMAISNLSKLDIAYKEGDIEEKRQIIGSMFPEKMVFDGTRHRTIRINEAVRIISLIDKELMGKKKGTSIDFSNLSQGVIPLGFEPRTPTLKVLCSTS